MRKEVIGNATLYLGDCLESKFIGIEQSAEYFDIACQRIENAQRQERLFA